VKHNEETGDNVAPAVIKCGLPPEQRKRAFTTEVSMDELRKDVKGPRANNYGVASNMPPDNPTKRADMLDVEDIKALLALNSSSGVVALCRCFKSAHFPLCDGSHNKHNAETGDNAGPLLIKNITGKPLAKPGPANHAGVPSNMPPDNPSRRVDILDIEDVARRVGDGGAVSICRCYKSGKFPLCDGTHVKHNEETGDNVAPAVIKCGLPPEQRRTKFATEISLEELRKQAKGPRANNYGVASNMPPDNPSKRADMLDVEDIKALVAEKGTVALCRCFKSAQFPLCDGSHNKHNQETGDNAGPLLIKSLSGQSPAPAPSEKAGSAENKDDGLEMISMTEVAKHNTLEDFWTVIHGKVYDLSDFILEHPGGSAIVKPYAGKVADEGFDPIHPESIIGENMPKVKLLGKVPKDELKGQKSETKEVERPPIDEVLSLYDMEVVAHAVMKSSSWGYYFTGERDEYTKTGNVLAFRQIKLVPRVMVDVSDVNTSTSLLGYKSSFPLYISAAAKGGLSMCQDAEVALSRAAFKYGVIQMAPHLGTKTLKEIADARQEDQVQFLQLYCEKNRAAAEETVKLATELGYKALFVTVDSAGIGKRETDLRYTPGGSAPRSKNTQRRWADDLTWEDIKFFRKLTDMKLCLKGVQCAEDALLAYKAGVDGIVVSNHGGRNCDTARPSLEVLVEVMDALRAAKYDERKFEVFMDGGIHRGGDIFKALAIGARAVGIGKAALLGMSAYGQEGVEKTLEILQEEFESTMQFMGCPSLKDISRSHIRGYDRLLTEPVWNYSSRDHLVPIRMPEGK